MSTRFLRPLLAVAALLFGVGLIAAQTSGNTTFFTSKGDIVFPFTPPTRSGTPGTIDNMVINQTTPAAATFTTLTANAIAGGDASLGVTGQAAASATAAGGAVPIVGGAGGATSGAGGAVSLTGGAATAGNSAGGAGSVVGGAGSGSAAGGAVGLTGGAGGATGAGGAIAITSGAGGATSGAAGAISLTVGSATSGNGASVTIAAGNGAGGTNAGGDIELTPGDAVSTGTPGLVKINGNAGLTCATFFTIGAPAAATDSVFFIATRPLYVVSISQVHAVAAGGASTLQVTKDTATDVPGAGADLLDSAFDLNATANTVQAGTVVSTVATRTLAAGDRLAVDFADAIQASSGIAVTACMAPV